MTPFRGQHVAYELRVECLLYPEDGCKRFFSETLVSLYQATRRHISEDNQLPIDRRNNRYSRMDKCVWNNRFCQNWLQLPYDLRYILLCFSVESYVAMQRGATVAEVLGAFAILRKGTVSVTMSLCPSVRLCFRSHGTTWLSRRILMKPDI